MFLFLSKKFQYLHHHHHHHLGVLIDEELKWVENIDYIYNKVVKYIGILYKLRNILPATVLQTIYFAFVHPHILYGIEMYGSASISHLVKLCKLNNKLLRILQRRDLCTRTEELYKKYFTSYQIVCYADTSICT